MFSVLVRLFGLPQVAIAEDIVQETLIAALEAWKLHGLPDNPRAWLYRVAKNKTIDFLRRERNFQAKLAPNLQIEAAQNVSPDQWLDDFFLDHEIQDAQLRMMFACCHPAIPIESQLALMLRTLGGLSTKEIAAAFLQPEDTISKRIFRAKEKIRLDKLLLQVPTGEALSPRLDAVLQAIYLLFNEGYKSSAESSVIRPDLCREALRLGSLLASHPNGNLPRTHALQALMCFQGSRLETRLNDAGQIVLLENQDRSRWNQALIGLGYAHFHDANQGNDLSEYHLEAAIASYHIAAPSFDKTNWQAIFYCYELLMQINPSPIVALNRAIVRGFSEGARAGIDSLSKIADLDHNYLYHTALGDFHVKNNDVTAALACYQKALDLVLLPAERQVIEEKIKNICPNL